MPGRTVRVTARHAAPGFAIAAEVEDEEKRGLKSVVAGLSVETELLREKIPGWRIAALWDSGGRDYEPQRLGFPQQVV